MIKVDDLINVKIEKMTHDFEGLARVGDENFVVFVKNALLDDEVKIKIISKSKNFARGEIVEIIKPSKHRIKPFCALYNACGSCGAQICDYDFLINQKSEILKDIFKNIIDEKNIFPVVKSPKTLEFRRKIQYPCASTKNSKRMLLGYFKKNSHDLVNIKFCPVAPFLMNEIAQFIRENFPLDCYCEKTRKGALRHVITRFNMKNEILITFVLNSLKIDKKIDRFAEKLMAEFQEIKGVFANLNFQKTNKILANQTLKIRGEDFIIENLDDKKFKIGAVSFFQVNPPAAVELFKIVKENIEPDSTILDAYGGVGAIGIFAGEKAKKITLVEEDETAVRFAGENFKLNNIENFEILSGDASAHFSNFEKEKRIFDYVILDPPRRGCTKEGIDAVSKIAREIIYVSCNPQTLKRDLLYFMQKNFKPEFVKGVDLFPFTHHIEAVCKLVKEK